MVYNATEHVLRIKEQRASTGVSRTMNAPVLTSSRPIPADNFQYADVPTGSYALWNMQLNRWFFFTVSRPKNGQWKGWTFLAKHVGENRVKVRDVPYQQIMSKIQREPQKCAANYGHQTGRCGMCGKELTDPKSIAKGIGPVCEKRF